MNQTCRMLMCGVLAVPVICSGCSDGAATASSVAASEGSVQTGLDAFASGDYAGAEKSLSEAIVAGAIQPDLLESAMRTLARARVQLGKTDEAAADLEKLRAAATEMDLFWVAMAELEQKKGNAQGVAEAIRQAKAANPRVIIPEGLR